MLLGPLAIPLPNPIRSRIDLSRWTAAGAQLWLHVVGIPVRGDGVDLHLTRSILEVQQGCDGVVQIMELLLLAGLALALCRTTRAEKIWVVASAIVLGFVGNAARIATLAQLADRGDMRSFEAWHIGPAAALWSLLPTAAAIALWWRLLRRRSAARSSSPRSTSTRTSSTST